MSYSRISWTDRVWNPTTGCSKVSAGCKNCYAERMANRKMPAGGFVDRPFTEVRCHPERLKLPLSWRKPSKIFVDSMSDLFHESVPDRFIGKVFASIATAHWHVFQVLTKRPQRMLEWSKAVAHYPKGDESQRPIHGWPPNCWLGVSVENQDTADERIPMLIDTPAAVHWVSVEPLLEYIDLSSYLGNYSSCDGYVPRMLDWVVIGGESGPGAREFNIDWARSIITQCGAAGVSAFMKQVGSNPLVWDVTRRRRGDTVRETSKRAKLKDRKGEDPSEWPEDIRIREFPNAPKEAKP